jgi:pimeloyl-ACP methyl ester carboxylesterase
MVISSRTIEANGLTFAIDECGEGPDVALCLHGFPESRLSWRYQLPLLAEKGWRAVAPDLRGYGGSSRPAGKAAYQIDRLVEDVSALFAALGAETESAGRPAGRKLLLAHDWGAIIAWIVAMRRTVALDGLVIMNVPHPAVFQRTLNTLWSQRKKSWYVLFFQIPWLPEAILRADHARGIGKAFTDSAVNKDRFPPGIVDQYRDSALLPGALTAMINYYRANFPDVLKEKVAVIEVPTLMVWGEQDVAIDIANTEGYEGLVNDFTLVRLPNSSHWVQQDTPDEVNAALAEWLARKGL